MNHLFLRLRIGAGLAAMLVLALAPLPALAADPAALAAAQRSLRQAVNSSEVPRILEARARFDALRAADPGSAALPYWIAVADWRAVPLISMRNHDKKAAMQRCKAGIAAAEAAILLDPKLAEAYAVRAGLLGLSIGFGSPASGITIGPKISADERRAHELAPDNPRVRLLEGIGTLHKPSFVGGGADKALSQLQQAIKLFEAETVADSLAPDWGRDDAYLWAGQAAMKLGDYAAARGYYQKALEANPENGWARFVLLPAAEKALAGGPEAKGKS